MPIPYMGSKRAIAEKLMNEMCLANPNADTFVDLFGGGGAMSEEALKRPQFKRVIYNELNQGVANLMRKLRDDGVTADMYDWVSREEFNRLKNGDDWKAGLIKTCWSFGNSQSSYVYGEKIEEAKKLGHDLVVNLCQKASDALGISLESIEAPTINERRLKFYKARKKINGERFQLEHLLQLERLEHLQHLQRLEHFEIHSQDAMTFDLSQFDTEKTVIYLDPPYQSTQKYQEAGLIDLDYFYNLPFNVYLSEYQASDKWSEVFSVEKRFMLSATNKKLKKIERLFLNR